MTTKTVYLFDVVGKFTGQYESQESPLEPGVFITPSKSTELAPPLLQSNETSEWDGVSWAVIPQVTPVAPEPVVTIQDVTPRQIRMALSRAGLRALVEAAVAAGNQDLKDWYEFSTTFQRNQPLVVQMGVDLGQTPGQLDALWQLAATL